MFGDLHGHKVKATDIQKRNNKKNIVVLQTRKLCTERRPRQSLEDSISQNLAGGRSEGACDLRKDTRTPFFQYSTPTHK